jgi:putative cell wall-binding protein
MTDSPEYTDQMRYFMYLVGDLPHPGTQSLNESMLNEWGDTPQVGPSKHQAQLEDIIRQLRDMAFKMTSEQESGNSDYLDGYETAMQKAAEMVEALANTIKTQMESNNGQENPKLPG